jgi:curved DNA-binding protein CbpA
VLSDPDLRKKYDKDGKEGLSADKTSGADGVAKVDAAILFAFLFGSDKFTDYTGRMATATSAMIGEMADSPKLSVDDARRLQKRRVTRLAIKLIAKIEPFVTAAEAKADTTAIEEEWKKEAQELSMASYGYQLVTTLGNLYNLLGVMYQGSMNNGQGIPNLAQWAERQKAQMDKKSKQNETKMKGMQAGVDMLKLQAELAQKMELAQTDEEKQTLANELESHSVGILLRILWTTTVVDLTSTIDEMTHMVFYDQAVEGDKRMARAEAVKKLGSIWMQVEQPKVTEGEKDAKQVYEDAAFAAMLETVKRRDASQSHKL